MSDVSDSVFDDERGSEVDDYTGQIPQVDPDVANAEPAAASPGAPTMIVSS